MKRVAIIPVFVCLLMGCGGGGRRSSNAEYTRLESQRELCSLKEETESFEWVDSCLKRLCDAPNSWANACFSRVKWLFENKRTADARVAANEFIREYPESAHGQSAVKKLAMSFMGRDELTLGIPVFRELSKKVEGTEVHDTVLYALANILGEAEKYREEEETLRAIVEKYDRWSSQLWDDALWRLVLIAEKTGRRDEEQSLLEQLLENREKSWIIGSYNSPYFDDAQLRLGEIALLNHQYDAALKWFVALGAIETSRLRDEGLVGAAKVRFAEGNLLDACKFLSKVQEIPSASSRKKAMNLAKSKGCP